MGHDDANTESAMYEKVRAFTVKYWNANESLTFYDHGRHAADGEGVSISFGGIRVEPDIYGIISSGAFEIPILGEGKLRMGGASGTNAVSQALAYRGLGMLAFVFFPESEFTTEASWFIESLCRQAGIGLLKVPEGAEPIRPKHVVIDLMGGNPAEAAGLCDRTLSQIKGLGSKNLGHVYPQSLRDFLSLFRTRRNARADLRERFERDWELFRFVLCQRPYDPMVNKKLSRNASEFRDEYFDRFLNALLSLGLVASIEENFVLKPWAEQILFAVQPGERFQSMLSPDVARAFAIALLREFDQPISVLLATLRNVGRPISSRSYCRNRQCDQQGGNDIKWFADTDDETLTPRCPKCHKTNVELGLRGQQWCNSGSWVPLLDYSVVKFASAVGILASRRRTSWSGLFSDLPEVMPSGHPIRWSYYWLGPVLDSRVAASAEMDEDSDDDTL